MGQINPGLIVAGRYRLLRKLGQGGMGTVWSARNELIDREVAIKMMRPEAAANPVSLQRFFTEAKASGRLRHPNITEIFDLGQAEDGSPFLVLELLTGEPLDSVLRRVPTLAPVQTLLLAKSIAAGLNVAHAKGIVHRDLKPANIFLHRDPITLDVIPKVLDFGISKVTGPEAIDHHATHTGTVVGSPTYMSPEQARGVSDIDARADIWSVGVLMYKCLTGRAPFNAANYNALMVAIMTEPHPPVQKWVPTVPTFVSEIIDNCLRKERSDRVQSAKALISLIDSALLGMNAERAKLELPSDDLDDDMPTIARGDRSDLIAMITASTAAAPASHAPSTTPPSTARASAPAGFANAPARPAAPSRPGGAPPPLPKSTQMGLAPPPPQPPASQSGGFSAVGGFAPAPSVPAVVVAPTAEIQPLFGMDNGQATGSPTVVSQPPIATTNMTATSVVQPRKRTGLVVGVVAILLVTGVGVGVALRMSTGSSPAASEGDKDKDKDEPTPKKKKPPKDDDSAASVGKIESPDDPPPKASAKPSTSVSVSAPASTPTATTNTPAPPTVTAPTVTAPPTVTQPVPTTTSVGTTKPTAKPTGTPTKKPPTSVDGPGF